MLTPWSEVSTPAELSIASVLRRMPCSAASAARSVPLYAFSPPLTRLTMTFRREGRAAAGDEFRRLERIWVPSVFGYGVVAIAAIGFAVTVWLGDDFVLSGVTAVVLLTGYIVHVGLTGMRTCYVRAVGRPGLEARYSTVWTIFTSLILVGSTAFRSSARMTKSASLPAAIEPLSFSSREL